MISEEQRPAYEEALNKYARHAWIKRMLAEIVVDMTIAQEIRHTDPMEFPNMLKKEIDNIVNIWKKEQHAKAANGNTRDLCVSSTSLISSSASADQLTLLFNE